MHEVFDITQLSSLMLDVQGQVQGVGFRPFLYRLASRHLLRGEIYNHANGAGATLEGNIENIEQFKIDFEKEIKEPIIVEKISYIKKEAQGFADLVIKKDVKLDILNEVHTRIHHIQADAGTCSNCWDDYFNKKSRFYGYAFTTCSECGPRWTISQKFPFERENTSYKKYSMCEDCAADYSSPNNRRFHAQTISCPKCGPQLQLYGPTIDKNPILKVSEMLSAGALGIIKGMGGYQLICDANNLNALQRLRRIKKRPHQALAVMFRDERIFTDYGGTSSDWKKLTASTAPIVCLPGLQLPMKSEISPELNETGCMSPTTTLHHAVMPSSGVLIVTSCNRHSFPISRTLDQIPFQISSDIDFILDHDREIVFSIDDSLIREETLLRAARGFSPKIHRTNHYFQKPTIALGADLKNSTALAYANYLIELPYNGTLGEIEACEVIRKQLQRQLDLLQIKPEIALYDRHPDTLTQDLYPDTHIRTFQISHHASHASAVMNSDSTLLLTFDGTGINHDTEVNGGEGFLFQNNKMRHMLTMVKMPMVAGDSSIRQPWKSLVSILASCGYEKQKIFNLLPELDENEVSVIYELSQNKNNLMCTSFGRWFDAASALIFFKNREASYEAQAPMLLEALAAQSKDYIDFKNSNEIKLKLICNDPSNYIIDINKNIYKPTNSEENLKTQFFSDEVKFKINGVKMISFLTDQYHDSNLNENNLSFLADQQKKLAFVAHCLAAEVTAFAVHKLQMLEKFENIIGTGGVFQNQVFTKLLKHHLLRYGLNFTTPHLQTVNDQSIALGQLMSHIRQNGESHA